MRAIKRTAATAALALAVIAASSLGAAAITIEPDEYSHTAAMFQIGMGARPLAMGGAFVGLANDENAVFYNPAGLAYLSRFGLTSTYSTQYDVVTYGTLGLATRGFGIAGLYLDSQGIQGSGEFSQLLPEFGYTNLGGVLGLGGKLGPLAIGVRGKCLSVTSAERNEDDTDLVEVTGQGCNVDAAAMVNLWILRVGAMVENLLEEQKLVYSNGHEEPWEKKVTAGASVLLGPLTLAADLENVGSEPQYYHAGVELALGPLALRAGATGPWGADGPSSDERDLTAGAGLRLGGLQVDYAYLMPQTLPQTHRLSLTLRF